MLRLLGVVFLFGTAMTYPRSFYFAFFGGEFRAFDFDLFEAPFAPIEPALRCALILGRGG
jgi:hypothetical protein